MNPLIRETDWLSEVGDIIAAIGTPELPARLDSALQRLVPFDLSVVFAYPQNARPLYLYDGFGRHAPGSALDAYLDGTYLLDPFYVAASHGMPTGLYRMRDVAPDGFFEGQYVHDWEVHPCISMDSGSLAEEIGYVVELPDGLPAVYSLMRSASSPVFDGDEFERLAHVEPVVREALRRQWPNQAPVDVSRPSATADNETESVLEQAFATFHADLLSTRERAVTQLMLRGHSTRSVALYLHIAEGTVKNHRKSIYAKLGIGSQQELFSLFLRHVLVGHTAPPA